MDTIKPMARQQKKPSEKIGLAVFLALYVFVFVLRVPGMIYDGATFIWIQVSIYGLLGVSGAFLFRQTFFVGFKKWRTAPLKSILCLLGAYAGGMLVMQIASLPAYIVGMEAPQNDANALLAIQMLGIPASILILGLAGPVVEEVIYRAFLIEKRKIPLWTCVILSSSLFALAHLHGLSLIDFVGILPHFAVAIVYGIVYAYTGNITLPLIIHVMNNTVAIISL